MHRMCIIFRNWPQILSETCTTLVFEKVHERIIKTKIMSLNFQRFYLIDLLTLYVYLQAYVCDFYVHT
jgi:hypothetical protein